MACPPLSPCVFAYPPWSDVTIISQSSSLNVGRFAIASRHLPMIPSHSLIAPR